jgi:hypothetical protein
VEKELWRTKIKYIRMKTIILIISSNYIIFPKKIDSYTNSIGAYFISSQIEAFGIKVMFSEIIKWTSTALSLSLSPQIPLLKHH